MIYVFLADGFEEIEALATVDVLRRADLPVCTVGIGKMDIIGAHNITVKADIIDTALSLTDTTAIVLPGGMPGTQNLEASSTVQSAIEYALSHELPIAAICAAPSILGHAQLLHGVCATCFPGFEDDLHGATVSRSAVVTDGLFTTAKGAGVAIDFALALVSRLSGQDAATQIREAMQCQ